MRGLDPRIHVFLSSKAKTWMAGTSPAMTEHYFRSATCFSCASPRSKSGPSMFSMLMNRQIALAMKSCGRECAR